MMVKTAHIAGLPVCDIVVVLGQCRLIVTLPLLQELCLQSVTSIRAQFSNTCDTASMNQSNNTEYTRFKQAKHKVRSGALFSASAQSPSSYGIILTIHNACFPSI